MRSIELFTGAGGLALGIHLAGFHHLAVLERDHDACNTLRLNSQRQTILDVHWNVKECDVHCFDYSEFSQDIELLAGGAPCQPFSLGGKHAGQADSRNLFPEVFRAVRELKPKAFLLENVKGLTREAFRPYFEYILLQSELPHVAHFTGEGWQEHKSRLLALRAAGRRVIEVSEHRYDVKRLVVDVADYGVPQRRHRVFIVGFRHDLGVNWNFPKATRSQDALLYAQYVDGSYWAEHDLPTPRVPENIEKRVSALSQMPKPKLARWRTVRDAIGGLPEPTDFDPSPSVANHVGIPDARSYKGHTGSPWDWPAKAIKAGDHGNPGGENMLRRDDGSVRYFTVRELARIQTFPDEWSFTGSWSESRRQLGNAVPVKMAQLLAERVSRALTMEPTEVVRDPT